VQNVEVHAPHPDALANGRMAFDNSGPDDFAIGHACDQENQDGA
jgi:hypothetical protein